MDSRGTSSLMNMNSASTSQDYSTNPKREPLHLAEKRERNKLAARRCRAKKSTVLQQLEAEVAATKKDNVNLATHVTTLVSLYQKEHRRAETYRNMLQLVCRGDSKLLQGHSVDELICHVEGGLLDPEVVLKLLAGVTADLGLGLDEVLNAAK